MSNYAIERTFMKSKITDSDHKLCADIAKGIPQPPVQKPVSETAIRINLPIIDSETAPKTDFFTCVMNRMSRRMYTPKPLSLFELSFLLWCTQGVTKIIGGYRKYLPDGSGINLLRPVAAGGAVPGFETYLAIMNVSGLECGIWRYLPLSHELAFVNKISNLPDKINATFSNPVQSQRYTMQAAVVFFWACTPYRAEWLNAGTCHKGLLLDLGHISQQLYLAAEALGCGCCAIGGYFQEKADNLISVDGEDEFTVLCAAAGHITGEKRTFIEGLPEKLI